VNFVIAREAGMDIVLVLPSAAIDVVGDASVKHSRFAGQNVNVEVAHGKAGASLSMTSFTVDSMCGRSQRFGAISAEVF
jgi:hypothetical protein